MPSSASCMQNTASLPPSGIILPQFPSTPSFQWEFMGLDGFKYIPSFMVNFIQMMSDNVSRCCVKRADDVSFTVEKKKKKR